MLRVALLACAACGRIGFDPAAAPDDAVGDGGPTIDARATATDPLPVSEPGAMAECPSIVWTGGGWGVAWRDQRDNAGGEIYFARLAADGSKLGPDVRLTNDAAATQCPAIGFNQGFYVVVYADDSLGDFELFGRAITAGGIVTPAIARLTNDNGESTQPVLAPLLGGFGVAYRDVRGVNSEVHFVRVGVDGTPLAPGGPLSNTGVFTNVPAVTPTSDGLAVAWYDDSDNAGGPQLRLALVDGTLGTERFDVSLGPATTGTSFTGPPALAFDGTGFALAWIIEPASQQREPVFARASTSGASAGSSPLVGGLAARMAMAAADGRLGLVTGVVFRLRGPNGLPIDEPIPHGFSDPALATDGTRFAVAGASGGAVKLVLITP